VDPGVHSSSWLPHRSSSGNKSAVSRGSGGCRPRYAVVEQHESETDHTGDRRDDSRVSDRGDSKAIDSCRQGNHSEEVVSPNFTTDGLGFMSQFLHDGGGQYIDIMAVHLYPNSAPEEDHPFLAAVQNNMQHSGISDNPLWNTEGASGSPSDTDQVASGLLARTYLLQCAWGISNFDWYCWDNAVGSPLSQVGYISPTAAGIAYEQVGSWLRGASMLFMSQEANGTWTITLCRNDGSLAYAIWNVNGDTDFSIPTGWNVDSAATLRAHLPP
jgi:hypothetical protein